jgi:hypothetical protein
MNTFRELDSAAGAPPLAPPPSDGEFPLPAWYRRVIDVSIDSLTVGDLARACRQEIHLPAILPKILPILADEPLAGEYCDGELMNATLGIGKGFWLDNPSRLAQLEALIAMHEADLWAELSDDVLRFRKRLQ